MPKRDRIIWRHDGSVTLRRTHRHLTPASARRLTRALDRATVYDVLTPAAQMFYVRRG